ncbi:glutathione S-transferase family protein [Sphingosinithalassobacter portus]|uniref:glutathione S-transferase family protein n=1 Tax=Stakelama portus TaxID=2676234 RepID=UPI000D6E6E51|nr:glutathione S-transferase [Sphingosinithalassobacter portus]
MLTIWGRINSHNVKKLLWLADELGLNYDRRDAGGQFGFPDAYRAMNPNALVPTIEDDGLVLWESNAILRYLAAKYATGTAFWPQDPAARAVGDKWMDWQIGYADAQRPMFMQMVRVAPQDRDAEAIAASLKAATAMMRILNDVLATTPWLSGAAFGLGDIPMGCYVNSWFQLDIDRPDLPALAAWYDRLKARPAYARHVMIALS